MELPVIDRFRLIRIIGAGGMGTVFEAHDLRRDLPVALKTMHRCDRAGVASLKREFRAAAQLVHPHLVQLHELIVDDERCFFTMELVDGEKLSDWVRGAAPAPTPATVERAPSSSVDLAPTEPASLRTERGKRAVPPPKNALPPPPFDEARLRQALAQLASALAFLHANGKAHRDVKPSNVLVDRDGNVKLVDFGLVLELVQPAGQKEALIAGTLPYMAPECLREGGGSAAADLYSLGALAFELVTGRLPYHGSLEELRRLHDRARLPRARSYNPALPRDLDALIAELLDEIPARRPRAVDVEARLGGSSSQAGAQPAPFVDRASDLAALEHALAAARSGVPRLVLAGSPSGLGKSALVRRFVAVAPRGTVVYRGRCYERERVAYRAFDRIIEDVAADLLHVPPAARPPMHSHALERVFPAFEPLALPDDAAPALDPLSERERGFTAFAELLRRQLDGTVGLFVVEDLQWTDAASLELLGCLLDHPGELPLLVLATYRPDDANRALAEFIAARRGRPEVLELGLEPLGDGDVRRLAAALGAEPLADEIVARSHGNPYVVEALAHEASSHRAGVVDVEHLEERRLERLGALDRGVLESVAIAGRPVTFALLRTISGAVDPCRLDESLRRLEAERLLRVAPADEEIGYDVYHDRIGRAARAQLDDARTEALHRAFAAALESIEAPSPHHHERMAHHLAGAGRRADAAPHAFAAAGAAMRKLAFEHAAEYYSRALALGLDGDDARRAEEQLALAQLAAGDYRRAAPVCRRLAFARQDDAWLLRAAEAEIKLGDLDSGVATLESLLRRHGLRFRSPFGHVVSLMTATLLSARLFASRERGHDDSPASAQLAELFRVASHFLSTPYPIEAWEFVLRSLGLARQRNDARGEACALAMIGAYLELATLRPIGEGPLVEAEAIGGADGYARVVSAACRLLCLALRGDWATMRAAAARGEALCVELGIERAWEASFLTTYAGSGELSAGNGERAAQLYRRLLDGRGCDLFTRSLARAQYGRALLLGGAVGDAARIAAELHGVPAMSNPAARFWLDLLDGELALARGAWSDALELVTAAEKRLRAGGLARLRIFGALFAVVRATAALGLACVSPSLSRWAAREAETLQKLARESWLEPTGYRLLGQAHALAGQRALADEALAHAERSARQRGGRLERVAVAALLGRAAPPDDLAAAVRWATAGVTDLRH